ncbi:hypothetical protein COCON_G00178920 [Conger conger]|uniref:H15 domain-containing protein n=1 Tax=Conger conger TaxID=82655 RepID=A0A9Q1HR62_CONCO|nr:protein B4 [Conger conger]KAJ8258880.1 hypothetical protein COCON_G00178920 [Conger conger]
MPPKKTVSVEIPDVEQPSTEEKKPSRKGGKHSENDSVADEPTEEAVTRKPSAHPSTMEMVKEAVKALDTRKGSSAQAIRRYILEHYPSMDQIRLKYMLRRALAKGLENGVLVRPLNSTANGAQGRFRLAPRGKAKAQKGTENADPNVEKPKVKTKAKGTGSAKPKPVAKKLVHEDSGTTLASKVAPAKKPKKAAGVTKAKDAVPKSKVGSKMRKAKATAKSPAKATAKSPAKATAKSPAKATAKSPAKTTAKSPAKQLAGPGGAAAKKLGKGKKKV